MQRISLAPVLSATRSRDSCWITSELLRHAGSLERSLAELDSDATPGGAVDRTALLGALEDLDDPPPLRRRERPRLTDEDEVADAGDVALVVRLDLARSAQDLAVQRVLDAVLDLDDDGLVHLVAADGPAALLAVAAALGTGARTDGVPGGLGHRSARGRGLCGGARRGGRRLLRALS